MTKRFPLSIEEEVAINKLGGIERCSPAVNLVLREHGIKRPLFSPSEADQVRQGRRRASSRTQIEFLFVPDKSLRANIEDLLCRAEEVQANAGGTNYVGAMLQHLVGAKLDLVLGKGKVEHHGFSVADQSTERQGDYQIETVTIHVTTHPTEALVRKCASNLQTGLKPLVITLGEGVAGAAFLLKNSGLADRVDVLDVAQFLTANVYERSFFHAAACRVTLSKLLERFNEIVTACETDPCLRIRLGGSTTQPEE